MKSLKAFLKVPIRVNSFHLALLLGQGHEVYASSTSLGTEHRQTLGKEVDWQSTVWDSKLTVTLDFRLLSDTYRDNATAEKDDMNN